MAGRPLRRVRGNGAHRNPDYSKMSQEDLVYAYLKGYEAYRDRAQEANTALTLLDEARYLGLPQSRVDEAQAEFQRTRDAEAPAMAAYMAIDPFLTTATKNKYLRTSRAAAEFMAGRPLRRARENRARSNPQFHYFNIWNVGDRIGDLTEIITQLTHEAAQIPPDRADMEAGELKNIVAEMVKVRGRLFEYYERVGRTPE